MIVSPKHKKAAASLLRDGPKARGTTRFRASVKRKHALCSLTRRTAELTAVSARQLWADFHAAPHGRSHRSRVLSALWNGATPALHCWLRFII